MKAGVIGLGQIGGGIAVCLARAGRLAAVYDLHDDAADRLEGVPTVAASPAEVARQSDVVIIAVVDAPQTLDVLSGPDGVLRAARPGVSVILVATVALEDLDAIRALTDSAGVALIDSGVVGGRKAGENGLICLVGAQDEELARVMPVFDGFARRVAHLGGPGAGMAGKIIYNAVFHATLRAGHEGAGLARAYGLDVHALDRVFRESTESVGGPLMAATLPGDPESDPDEAQKRLRLSSVMTKDLEAALALARAHKIEVPMISFTRETITDVMGLGATPISRSRQTRP
ncbi:NAD(P)-binding domain-containing protein [Streptomyces sp. NBC_01622]|uniref:NAD(P)-dependent oxidoreductase n=1 Tax=Streptomyces sp. NBC_01622 TaxID=2975903 RepID=UPI0038672010|nr:NAD(P)-binding domain-containing protein [Streptomyces sp. NBC_01622]